MTTMNIGGKMQNTIGISIFTGAFIAFSKPLLPGRNSTRNVVDSPVGFLKQ